MHRMKAVAASLLCGLAMAPAAFAQTAPNRPAAARPAPAAPAPQPPDDQEPAPQGDGGAGFLPGAQFQRKLDGGPGFVCTATNALRDQKCSVSCHAGEMADCVDAEGSGTPSCACTKG